MNRILSCLVVILLITASACSAKKPIEQTAYKSKTVLTVLRDLDKYYEKKDLDSFMSDVAMSYVDRDAFAKSIAGVFSKYELIHFNIQFSKMIILIDQASKMRVTFTWDAEWTVAGGTSVKDGGRVTFIFEPGDFKLISIDGKNPFLAQPGETPGSKQ
ncbi:MAG TPA: hypothetical protein VEI57_03215 [Nitrospirota bacterium]|nr:hypothetical protein [Nitrospirota bacterium]